MRKSNYAIIKEQYIEFTCPYCGSTQMLFADFRPENQDSCVSIICGICDEEVELAEEDCKNR